MLYRTIKRMIERGQMDGIEERTDVLYALGKLSAEEYKELLAMLHPEKPEEA